MTADVVERVRQSSRYRDVDVALVTRLAAEELPKARSADDAVKRVKRRLHQAIGAFRGAAGHGPARSVAWTGDLQDTEFRAACAVLLGSHASTRERLPHLDDFYERIWAVTGRPHRLVDLGCGLAPVALPWMGLDPAAHYTARDADERTLATVRTFLATVGQPHDVRPQDLVAEPDVPPADVALLLKLVTTLDRQAPDAATRLLDRLDAPFAVASFTTRSLGGGRRNLEPTYRARLERLVAEVGERREVEMAGDASVPGELVAVLALGPRHG
jgi:16S rRNA (guanine(1405)-N(7))-methyltransferase